MQNWRDWTGLGSEQTRGKKDWHECIDYQKEFETGILSGKNQYLDDEFEKTVNAYIEQLENLSRLIMSCILLSLDLTIDSNMMNNFEDNFYIFCQLFYPEFPAESDDESIGLGVGEHTDYGFLTMITADRGGLEIEVDGDWKEIKMIDDYLVCNIGDMLAHWSGTLKATPHRVRRLKGARHSVA